MSNTSEIYLYSLTDSLKSSKHEGFSTKALYAFKTLFNFSLNFTVYS